MESYEEPDQLAELTARAKTKAEEALQTSQKYIRANPVYFSLGALVVGTAIVALVLARNPRRPSLHQRGDAIRQFSEDLIADIASKTQRFQAEHSAADVVDKLQVAAKKLKWW